MKKLTPLIAFCICLGFIGGLLSTNAAAQQISSGNLGRTDRNIRKVKSSQTETTPPRSPKQVEVFQSLVFTAIMRGTAQARVITRNFEDRAELLRQLAPFQVRVVALFELSPQMILQADATAIIYMRDSDLVTDIQENRFFHLDPPLVRSLVETMYFRLLFAHATANGQVRVIVGLNINFIPEGNLTLEQRVAQRAAIRQAQDILLARLAPFQVRLIAQYEFIPFIAVHANASALKFMRSFHVVKNLREDAINTF